MIYYLQSVLMNTGIKVLAHTLIIGKSFIIPKYDITGCDYYTCIRKY